MKKILFTFLFSLFFNRVYAIENIHVNKESLIPKFDTNIRKYNYFTDSDSINIEVENSNEVENSKDEIISGNGKFDINDGINTFIIDSNINGKYEINVFKNYKEDKDTFGNLVNLEIDNYDINFDPNTYEYNISISDEDKLNISYELLNDSSYVSISGNGNFNKPKNEIIINVDNIKEYKINVLKTLTVSKNEIVEKEVESLSNTKKEIVKLIIITISCSLVFILFYLLFIKKLF